MNRASHRQRRWLARFMRFRFTVFKYIETFYNTIRLHQPLEYQMPGQNEANYLLPIAT